MLSQNTVHCPTIWVLCQPILGDNVKINQLNQSLVSSRLNALDCRRGVRENQSAVLASKPARLWPHLGCVPNKHPWLSGYAPDRRGIRPAKAFGGVKGATAERPLRPAEGVSQDFHIRRRGISHRASVVQGDRPPKATQRNSQGGILSVSLPYNRTGA
jgi:hypothetical protein